MSIAASISILYGLRRCDSVAATLRPDAPAASDESPDSSPASEFGPEVEPASVADEREVVDRPEVEAVTRRFGPETLLELDIGAGFGRLATELSSASAVTLVVPAPDELATDDGCGIELAPPSRD